MIIKLFSLYEKTLINDNNRLQVFFLNTIYFSSRTVFAAFSPATIPEVRAQPCAAPP